MARYAVTLLVLIALLAAATLADRPAPRADFAFVTRGDVTTLDPQRLSWIPDFRVARMMFDALVENDVLHADYPIIPCAAERWEVSADGLTYTFHLRPDGRWSSGDPVTAHDFRYAWRRAMLPDLASDYVGMFMLIEGAQAFFDWRVEQLERFATGQSHYSDGAELWQATAAAFDRMVALTAVDDLTLSFRLARPVPYFLELCTLSVFAPVYPPLVDEYERPDPVTGRLQREQGWTKPGRLITNGRYQLDAWRFKREMRLSPNPHHWDRGNLHLRSISVQAIDDPSAAVLAFRSGVVDWVPDLAVGYRAEILAEKRAFRLEHAEEVAAFERQGLDPFSIDRLLPADPRASLHVVPVLGTYWYNFNCSPRLADGRVNPLADARVRRALAMTIDKRAVTEQVRRLGEPVASSLVPAGALAGYTPPRGLPNVGSAESPEALEAIVAEARELLAQAGYPDPAADFPITVDLMFNEDAGHDLIAQVIAKNWSRHLGLPTSLTQKELKVFREDLRNHTYVTARGSWYADYPDATTFLDINRTGDGNNDRNYQSPEYDALLTAAEAEPDAAARLALLARAERLIMEIDVPMAPIFHYVDVTMFDPHRVTGLSAHPRVKDNVYLVDILGDGIGADRPRPMRRGPTTPPPPGANP